MNLSTGASEYHKGKLVYDYKLHCSTTTWEQVGQTAFGWGAPGTATISRIVFSVEGDSILTLKSLNGNTALTYILRHQAAAP
jgi:hypothetical protein